MKIEGTVGPDFSGNGPPPPPPETFASAATSSPSRGKGPLVALATALAVLLALAVGFWFVSARTAGADSDEMDEALAGLETSISSAEKALDRAKSSKAELAVQAEKSGDPAAAQLAGEAEEAIVQFAEALDGARQVRATGETQKPSKELVEKVEQAAASLESLTLELDEVTGTVEETTQELQAGPPEMNLAEIAQGNFSSIEGTWVGVERTRAEVTASTIDWYLDDELYARLEGLTYTALKGSSDVQQGQQFESHGEEWQDDALWLYYDYYTANVPSGHAAKGDIAFFEAGVPLPNGEVSDESLPRILWFGQNQYGRGDRYTPLADRVMYRTGDASDKPVEETASKPVTCVPPVEGAYPCAGGPVPADVKSLTVQNDPVGGSSFVGGQTPSGNITCEVTDASASHDALALCVVSSWPPEINPDYDPDGSGGYAAVGLGTTGPAAMASKGDPMISKNSGVFIGEVLPYGTVWRYGDFVFASEEAGLTFWNASSGYGALVNRSGFYPFGPE